MRLNEFGNEKLAQYKTAAAADAAKADAAGDFKKGNKRFKGINTATKKQFANDAKKKDVAEGVAETVSMDQAKKVLRHYGADHFKTTTNELHFYKNGQHMSVDLIFNDDATRSVNLSQLNSATRRLKGQGVAEATGDERFDSMMGQIQREPTIPDAQMPPTDVKDLYQWAVKNNKPYHKIFAEWANREGYKSVAPALQKAGNLDSDALDYWTPDVWKVWYGPDAEMPHHWSKERVPDELRDYLETVFDAYENIWQDWPTEYRQIGEQIDEVFADQGSGSTDRDNADYMKRRNAANKAGYTGRETKAGTWRVFKDGNAVAAAGPFNSADEAAAWIKKHKQGVTEMDKSEPSAGRDGGPREGPDQAAKPITAKKATRDAGRMLNRAVKDSRKKKDVAEDSLAAMRRLAGIVTPMPAVVANGPRQYRHMPTAVQPR